MLWGGLKGSNTFITRQQTLAAELHMLICCYSARSECLFLRGEGGGCSKVSAWQQITPRAAARVCRAHLRKWANECVKAVLMDTSQEAQDLSGLHQISVRASNVML